ncbi:arabinose import ATP-binding protein AraG, partial [Yersinia pestis PY-64]
MSAPHSALQA